MAQKVARARAARRSKIASTPDDDEFWLVLDTITDAQRELEEHARRARVKLCHELGEMLAIRLAEHGWTRDTLADLSGFLSEKGVSHELAAVASLVRMLRMIQHERELTDDRGLALIFEPPPHVRLDPPRDRSPAAWSFVLGPLDDEFGSSSGDLCRPANP